MRRGLFSARRALFDFISAAGFNSPRLRLGVEGMRQEDQTEDRKRKQALAASGRRTREELWAPVADMGARLRNRRWGTDLDQHNGCIGNCNRGSGVHGDAQRALVGSGFSLMEVRRPERPRRRPEGQCRKRPPPANTRLSAAFLSELWRESCQPTDPPLKDTQNWTLRRWRWLPAVRGF